MAYGQYTLTQKEKDYYISLFRYMIDELNRGRES